MQPYNLKRGYSTHGWAGERGEDAVQASIRMYGKEVYLTQGDLMQFTLSLSKCIMKLTLRQKSADL